MKGGLPTTLALFAKFIARIMGLHFTEERHLELSQKMAAVAKDAGFSDLEQYLLWLMSAPLSREQLETLASALTIGETYFLRDPGSYQILEQQLLPGLVARRRGSDQALRIWSAGCSTGEEPYTLAIILSRVIPDLANWNISLTGTDINPQALERGRQGIYGSWSFRNAPPWLMDYFTRLDDGRFQVIPRIRALVRFEHLNLADAGSGPEGSGTSFLDLVFCRNVMLYFEQIQIERTMRRFHAALREGGWLFVGPTEVDQSLMKGFTCQRFTGALVLRKGADQAHGAAAHPSAAGRLPSPHRLPSAAGAVPAASAPAPLGAATADAAASQLPPALPPAEMSRPAPATAAGNPGGAVPRADASASAPSRAGEPAGERHPAAADCHPEAFALYQAGNYQQVADRVRRALDAGPQPAATLALGARALANLGRFSEARELCEQAIASDRLSAESHYLLSIILEQQGELAAAIGSLKQLLFIDHDYLLAYFALGNLYRQEGSRRESERNFANALRLLERQDPHEVLPEAEGMTAGHLARIIRSMTEERSAHGKR